MAIDVVASKEAAERKGISSVIAGKVDPHDSAEHRVRATSTARRSYITAHAKSAGRRPRREGPDNPRLAHGTTTRRSSTPSLSPASSREECTVADTRRRPGLDLDEDRGLRWRERDIREKSAVPRRGAREVWNDTRAASRALRGDSVGSFRRRASALANSTPPSAAAGCSRPFRLGRTSSTTL